MKYPVICNWITYMKEGITVMLREFDETENNEEDLIIDDQIVLIDEEDLYMNCHSILCSYACLKAAFYGQYFDIVICNDSGRYFTLFRDIKSSHLLVVLELEDKSGNSVKGKLITKKQNKEELKAALQIGESVSLSGVIVYDQFESAYVMECITGIS